MSRESSSLSGADDCQDSPDGQGRAPSVERGLEVDCEAAWSIEGLPLDCPTGPAWVGFAIADLGALLRDHAHCEIKAAATGFRLLGSYPDREDIVAAMSSLVREEMRHFERVRELVLARGLALGKAPPDRYVKALRKAIVPGGSPRTDLVDRLLVCTLVEARSCERFRLLARAPIDQGLRDFYAELSLAEDRHHELFLNLARETDEARMRRRLPLVRAAEAEIITALPPLSAIH